MTQKLEIKGYFSSDLEKVWDFSEPIRQTFVFPLDVYIGPEGSESSDIYSILVISEDNFEYHRYEERRLVLPYFDSKLLLSIIDALFKFCMRQHDPLLALRQSFRWEYEGYRG